ncbi:MAG: hypothetical protein QW273_01110 [Candidatus Pacearchaeota archaeon]
MNEKMKSDRKLERERKERLEEKLNSEKSSFYEKAILYLCSIKGNGIIGSFYTSPLFEFWKESKIIAEENKSINAMTALGEIIIYGGNFTRERIKDRTLIDYDSYARSPIDKNVSYPIVSLNPFTGESEVIGKSDYFIKAIAGVKKKI